MVAIFSFIPFFIALFFLGFMLLMIYPIDNRITKSDIKIGFVIFFFSSILGMLIYSGIFCSTYYNKEKVIDKVVTITQVNKDNYINYAPFINFPLHLNYKILKGIDDGEKYYNIDIEYKSFSLYFVYNKNAHINNILLNKYDLYLFLKDLGKEKYENIDKEVLKEIGFKID